MSAWLLIALNTAAASLAVVRMDRPDDDDEPICYGPLALYGRCDDD